jgi:hypothetical protein
MPTRLTIASRFAAPLLVGTLTLVACGSDGKTDATPAEDRTAITLAEEATAVTSAEEPAVAVAPAYTEFCTVLEEYIQRIDTDEEDDPNDIESIGKIVDVAPPEIADDMADLLEMFVQIAEFDDVTATEEEQAEFGAVLEKFEPLAAKMEAWWTANCPGFELD